MVLSTLHSSIECFKVFVAGNQFEKIECRRGVLVLGQMASGKSTTISVQLGAEYEALDSGHLKLIYSPQWIPQTSDDWVSKTLQVQLYHDTQSDFLYLDTAGLNENRGGVYRDWTSFSTAMVFSLLKDVQAVIIMVDFSEAFGTRGEGIRKLAEPLNPITGRGDSSQFFYNSAIFVYTNAWRNGKPLSPQSISSTASSMLDAEKRNLQTTVSALEEQHGRRTMEAHGKIQIKWEDVSDADKKSVHDSEASILLLQAMVQQHENGCAVTSCLSGVKSCRSQRQALNKLIRQVPGITKTQLEGIVAERETKSLAVNNMLVNIITQSDDHASLLAVTTKRADCIEQLVELSKQYGPLMTSIQHGDWKGVRVGLVTAKATKKRELERNKQKHQDEKSRLETSEDMVVTVMDEVRETKSSGLFSWTLFGGGWAEKLYERSDRSSYDREGVEGQRFTKAEISKNPAKGMLKLKFQSESGYNLHVDVKTLQKERNYPPTIERVQLLSDSIAGVEHQITTIDSDILHMNATTTKEQLVDIIAAEKPALEQELERISCDLKQARTGVPVTEDDVSNSMMRLISLLNRTPGGISTNLAPAPRATLDEFLKQSDRLRMGQRTVEADPIMKTWSRALESVKEEAITGLDERDAPLVGLAGQAAGVASGVGRHAASTTKDLFHVLQARIKEAPGVFGCFFLAVAYSLPYWYVAFLVRCIGIFLVISGMRGAVAESFQYVANAMSFMMERCFGVFLEIPQDIHSTIQSCVSRLASKLSCNINFDWRNEESSGGLLSMIGPVVGFLKPFFTGLL